MGNVSQPRAELPEDWPTIWRMASDQNTLVSYFEDTFSPNAGTRTLQLHGNPALAGDQTTNFTPAQPFAFMVPQD